MVIVIERRDSAEVRRYGVAVTDLLRSCLPYHQRAIRSVRDFTRYAVTFMRSRRSPQERSSPPCAQTITPLKDEAGATLHYVSVSKDVTELMTRTQDLRGSRSRRKADRRWCRVRSPMQRHASTDVVARYSQSQALADLPSAVKVLVDFHGGAASWAHDADQRGRRASGPLSVANQPQAGHVACSRAIHGDFRLLHDSQRFQRLQGWPEARAPEDCVKRHCRSVAPSRAVSRESLKDVKRLQNTTLSGLHDRRHHDNVAEPTREVCGVSAFLEGLPACSRTLKQHSSIYLIWQKRWRLQCRPGCRGGHEGDFCENLGAGVSTAYHHHALSGEWFGRNIVGGMQLSAGK